MLPTGPDERNDMKPYTPDARSRARVACAVLLLFAALPAAARCGATDAVPAVPVDIPSLSGITIDGDPSDWAGGGYIVDIIPDESGRLLPAADFDPRLRLGWCGEGLLVLAEVADDVPREHEEERYLWRMDCVELFVAAAVEANGGTISFVDPGGPGSRCRIELPVARTPRSCYNPAVCGILDSQLRSCREEWS